MASMRDRPVDLGDAPDFEAAGLDGHTLRLSGHRGRKAVVLVFLRGLG